jgi:hypothetical protein
MFDPARVREYETGDEEDVRGALTEFELGTGRDESRLIRRDGLGFSLRAREARQSLGPHT